jgi:Type II secretion system (T2SS), protein E, N-terminal domain/Tetratricopeptide repeat
MASISEDENQQLLRTVEMFEAITESQPEDYQSWEILKEAYSKLGRRPESLRASKKLAKAHISLGQISQAILEFEGILQEYPNDPEVLAALLEIEAKTSQLSTARQPSGAPSLREDSKPTPSAPTLAAGAAAPPSSSAKSTPEDGNKALIDVLLAEKLITVQAVEPLLKRLASSPAGSSENAQPLTLPQLLIDEQLIKLEDFLSLLVDRSGLPYLPLSTYDVDRDAACLLPRELCFENCIVPFDLISRSVLIATANPFDLAIRSQAQTMLAYNVFWYVTSPEEIQTALRRAHGLDTKHPQGARISGKP